MSGTMFVSGFFTGILFTVVAILLFKAAGGGGDEE